MEYSTSPPRRKASNESGFFEVALSADTIPPPIDVQHQEPELPPKVPVTKKPSLKKKTSGSVFDGAIHMGYLWYFNQNPKNSKSPEELLFKSKEEKLTRILRLDPKCTRNQWKRYFAVIWSDGRFAWYKPDKIAMYSKRSSAELEEVLFVPWRVCAFGHDVIYKLCSTIQASTEDASDQNDKLDTTLSPMSPKLPPSNSTPTHWSSLLESATKGLCICASPSVVSLVVPASPASTESQEELVCIMPKTSKESLLIAVGGQDFHTGDVYCFASENVEDLELWRDSFALLTHRKTVQRSAFDHLLNTPVVITLPIGIPRS